MPAALQRAPTSLKYRQPVERLDTPHRRHDDILHAGCLMRRDAFVPPFERLGEIARGQLLVRKVERAVGRQHLHARRLYVAAELLGGGSVKQSVLVAGGLHEGISHIGERLQHGLIVSLALAEHPDERAYRIELDADLLLGPLPRACGRCPRREHRRSEQEADRCKQFSFHRTNGRLVEHLDADVAEPDVVAVIL